MNGVHDLGGMHGFGPIVREENEPVFHAEWEAHVRGLYGTIPRWCFSLDALRNGIERMEPAHYLQASYYERWLFSITSNLIEAGVLTGDELEARTEFLRQQPDAAPRPQGDVTPLPPAPVAAPRSDMPPPTPRFAVGDAVLTRNVHPTGHTRLPRYARGKRGVIHLVHGAAVFPDTNAHGLGEHPQVVYNVRFDGRELWGDSAEPRATVSIDLWESYLDQAPR